MSGAGSGRATLRIGVTGHRVLPDDPAFRARLEETVDRLLSGAGTGEDESPVRVVSALAEGADRLVATLVLRAPGATLEAILPREPADYEADFAESASREAFRALLGRAERIEVVPATETRTAGYEAAGHAMLARVDALVAVWDGRPARGRGGTAEVVARALADGVPVEWVSTVAPFPVRRLDGPSDLRPDGGIA